MRPVFHVYTDGHNRPYRRVVENLQKLNEIYCNSQAEIKIVDLPTFPQHAISERIVATPTVVKTSPPPQRRVIGDLSNLMKAAVGLGLASPSEIV